MFEMNDRMEINGGIRVNVFDLDYGDVLVTGGNYYAGSGGYLPLQTSFFAKIGPFAKLTIENSLLPLKEFLIKDVDKTTTSSPEEILVIRDSNINNGQSSGHPFVLFENSSGTRLTLANVYDSGFTVRKVKVINAQGKDNAFDYEYGSKKTEKSTIMVSHNVGSNSYAEGFKIRIPYNFVIDQIRLFNTSHPISDIDGIRISLQYAGGSEWVYSTTIPLDGNENYGKRLLDNQIITCTNGLAFLELHFMKGTQRTNSKMPSYVEIDYRGITRKSDFQGDTIGLIKKNVF